MKNVFLDMNKKHSRLKPCPHWRL